MVCPQNQTILDLRYLEAFRTEPGRIRRQLNRQCAELWHRLGIRSHRRRSPIVIRRDRRGSIELLCRQDHGGQCSVLDEFATVSTLMTAAVIVAKRRPERTSVTSTKRAPTAPGDK